MNKKELITLVANKEGVAKAQVERILESFFDVVKNLKPGEKVKISMFGTFYGYTIKGRLYQIPKTTKVIKTQPRNTIKFKASKSIK